MTFSTLRRLAALAAALLLGLAPAQELSADEVLEHVKSEAETLQDAQFTVTGSLTDADGTTLPLELYVQTIPGAKAARADIVQPDALADNAIVLAGDAVYNYTFLTNQVTIFPADDPDALGGLFPEGNVDEGFDLTFNPEQLFRGWQASVTGYADTPLGPAYQLRFVNDEAGALVAYVDATILDGSWVPYTLGFFNAEDKELVSLMITDFVRDQGLEPARVTELPADAEVIDER